MSRLDEPDVRTDPRIEYMPHSYRDYWSRWPEVTDLRVSKLPGAVRVVWTDLADPCTTYRVLSSEWPNDLTEVEAGLSTPEHADDRPTPAAGALFYRVTAFSIVGGEGP